MIFFSFFLCFIINIFLALSHSISCFFINTFLQNFSENIFLYRLHSKLKNALFIVSSLISFCVSNFFIRFDLWLTFLLHLINLFKKLLFLIFIIVFLYIFFVHVSHFSMTYKIKSIYFIRLSKYLSFLVMIVYQDKIFFNIEFSFSDLILSWLIRIKFKLLSHFPNTIFFLVMFIINKKMNSLINKLIGVICNASINKFVFSSLKSFKSLFAYLFFPIDKTIFNSVMIKEYLSVLIIFLNQLFPIVLFLRGFIMFNCCKPVRESSS